MFFVAIGSFFALLTFIHFFSDWIFQTHSEAMIKHNNWKIRAKHCLIYTFIFIPFLYSFKLNLLEMFVSANLLFWSHFYFDTYRSVFLWAKYIRKPPEMNQEDKKAGFVNFVSTPLGKILMIAIDQISHIAFLLPIAYFAAKHV